MPVWHKTGDFLYFVARKTNPDSKPNLQIDERLMRYDVRTQKTERLLSLRAQQSYAYIQTVSISPNGYMLEFHSATSESQNEFVFMDVRSLSTTKFGVYMKIPATRAFSSGTAWSSDNQNIIFFIGEYETPNRLGVRHYGAFYTLNATNGKTNIISGNYWVDEWAVSPVTSSLSNSK